MASRKPLPANPDFPLTSSDDLWDRVAQGDAPTIRGLLDLGLHPLASLAGRYRKGNPESTTLWLMACEAPSAAGLMLMWQRLNAQERLAAMASRNGQRLPGMELAMKHGALEVMESLVTFNQELPARQQSRWNGWALLFTSLGQRDQDHREQGAQPEQRRRDAAVVRTMDRLGLLGDAPTNAGPASRSNPGAYECLIEAIRNGATGCVDVLIERPMPWSPVCLGNPMPWGWILFTSPHPHLPLQRLIGHNVVPDMTTGATPEAWQEFVRSFVMEPFRTPAMEKVSPSELLQRDPRCQVVMEGHALRQVADAATDANPRIRPRL